MRGWYVVKCPHCHKWQVIETEDITKYSLRCKFCGKTTKIKQKDKFGYAIEVRGSFSNPYIARYQAEARNKLEAGK